MAYRGSGQSKSYDRLRVPERPEKRKTHTSTLNYADSARRRDSNRTRSQTLQYTFDFSRPTSSGQSQRKRLSATPNVIEQPNEARPAGRSRPPERNAHDSRGTAARTQVRPSLSASKNRYNQRERARPTAANVTDFQKVGAKAQQRQHASTIRAPRLSDPETLRSAKRTQDRAAEHERFSGSSTTREPRASDRAARHLQNVAEQINDVHSAPMQPSQSGKSVRPALNPARGASDQSASTVVGFDISRSVFARSEDRPVVYESAPVEARTERTKRLKNTLSTIFVMVTVFAMLAVSLVLSSRVSDVARQNSELERENDSIREDIRKAEMQIALEEDLNNVRERAAILGMAAPNEEQIEHVVLEGSIDGASDQTDDAGA